MFQFSISQIAIEKSDIATMSVVTLNHYHYISLQPISHQSGDADFYNRLSLPK